MKILVVSNMYPSKNFPSYGTFVKNFCSQLELLNIQYDLSVMYKTNLRIGKLFLYILFYVKTLFLVLYKKYDIVYIHYASHSALPVLLAKKIKRNLIIFTNLHGSDVVPENKKQEKMQKYTEQIVDISKKVIVPSEYFKNYVIKKYKLNPKKVFVYPSGGLNKSIFFKVDKSRGQEILNKYNLEENIKYIAFVSRITKDKGWDTYCLALKMLKNKNYNIKGLIVGDGNEKKELLEMISRLELNKNVILLPSLSQEELNEIYNCVDCLVFPSRREGESLGLIPLEAMAAETLVIVNDYAAPANYIKSNYNGLKFKVNSYEDLCKKIIQSLNMENEEKIKIITNAKKTVSEFFVENVIKKLEKIIIE